MLSSSGRSAARLPPGGQDPLAIAKSCLGDRQEQSWRSPNTLLAIAKGILGDRQIPFGDRQDQICTPHSYQQHARFRPRPQVRRRVMGASSYLLRYST